MTLLDLIESRMAMVDNINASLAARKALRGIRSERSRKGAETCRANFRRMDAFKEGME